VDGGPLLAKPRGGASSALLFFDLLSRLPLGILRYFRSEGGGGDESITKVVADLSRQRRER